MTVSEALTIKEEARMEALEAAKQKRDELYKKMPAIRVIDKQLEALPFRLFGGESKEALAAEAEQLNSRRADLIKLLGLEPNYDTPVFQCKECDDSGYTNGLKVCQCIKNMVANSRYTQSSLAKGLIDKSFDNFSLSYYPEENGRTQMEGILRGCKRYAESFPNDSSAGLLFIGGTGLGKTHLSAAIANAVATRGYSVVYESAQQIFDTCDAVRFNRMDIAEKEKYEKCALLVIDDLGAECITQYSVASTASLIDNRIVNGKATIINTNLTPDKIKKTYGERLISRLLGEFRVLQFVGKDIRMQKINK